MATPAEKATAFGAAVNRVYSAALIDWRDSYAPNIPLTDLLAGPLSSITVEATVFANGYLTVISTVRGRRTSQDEQHLSRFRMHGGTYRLTGSSLPLV